MPFFSFESPAPLKHRIAIAVITGHSSSFPVSYGAQRDYRDMETAVSHARPCDSAPFVSSLARPPLCHFRSYPSPPPTVISRTAPTPRSTLSAPRQPFPRPMQKNQKMLSTAHLQIMSKYTIIVHPYFPLHKTHVPLGCYTLCPLSLSWPFFHVRCFCSAFVRTPALYCGSYTRWAALVSPL